MKKRLFAVVLVLGCLMIGCGQGDADEPTTPTAGSMPTAAIEPTEVPEPTPTLEPTATPIPTPTPEPTATPIPTPTPEPTPTPVIVDDPNATASQINAVLTARDTCGGLSVSRKGAIDKLLAAGFSQEDAVYGVDNSGIDWLKKAMILTETSIDFENATRQDMLDKLESFEYTKDEIAQVMKIYFSEE